MEFTQYRFNRLIDFATHLEELAKQRELLAMRALPKQAELLTREKFTLRNVAMMVRRLELVELGILQDTLEGIRAALDTEETGTNLIEVARDAHNEALRLSKLERENKILAFKPSIKPKK